VTCRSAGLFRRRSFRTSLVSLVARRSCRSSLPSLAARVSRRSRLSPLASLASRVSRRSRRSSLASLVACVARRLRHSSARVFCRSKFAFSRVEASATSRLSPSVKAVETLLVYRSAGLFQMSSLLLLALSRRARRVNDCRPPKKRLKPC